MNPALVIEAHGKHAQALVRQIGNLNFKPRAFFIGKSRQFKNCFRRALCRVAFSRRIAPALDKGEEIGADRKASNRFAFWRYAGVRRMGVNGAVHRIDRIQ